MFHTLKLLPAHILGLEGEQVGIVVFSVGGAFLMLVPFLDRRASRGERSPLFSLVGWLMLAYLAVFTVLGYLAA
jgi:cytochrome b6